MTNSDASNHQHAPLDPGQLSVREALARYPVGKLITIVSSLISVFGAAGFWLGTKLSSEELRHCKEEYQTLLKHDEQLQHAINSGQCVRSDFLAKQEEARRFIGALEVQLRAAEDVRRDTINRSLRPSPAFGPALQSDYSTWIDLGRFLDDSKVTEQIAELRTLTVKVNENIDQMWGAAQTVREKGRGVSSKDEALLTEANKQFDDLRDALVRTREYFKSKYVIAPP